MKNLLEQIERPKLSKEQICHWIEKFRLIDKNDLTQRQRLIDVFVNAAYVYEYKLLNARRAKRIKKQ